MNSTPSPQPSSVDSSQSVEDEMHTWNSSPEPASTCATSRIDSEVEMHLLNFDTTLDNAADQHELATAPLLTRAAYEMSGLAQKNSQYGVLGSVTAIWQVYLIRNLDKGHNYTPQDPRLYINTNAPFSAIVCGVQGSGKSHTVSVLLENMLVSGCDAIGVSHKTLSGLVLHFGEGGSTSLPCEAAFIGHGSNMPGACPPKIKVFVSRSSLTRIRRVYSVLGDAVTVEPLQFSESELDAESILSMMAVGMSDSAPLYVQRILVSRADVFISECEFDTDNSMQAIMRELGEAFTYHRFLKEVERAKKDMSTMQIPPLDQRMALLKAYVDTSAHVAKTRFKPGQLTVVDLSDPFIDPPMACALFEIATRLFVRADVETGKVLVVDEAHKRVYWAHKKPDVVDTAATASRDESDYQHTR
ncbi:hypothetical protein GSI_00583 [Ganoderma sinense ZZ0214-1]|uniref:Uncharacterized protein n=1 Tax=Ganoderma sinense ZZ0214-1 TaxID=1077348 RepID=A0A2G8ST58_9APHY|nr:hypothetical protein GSI_00583 [Ganoderma sinense ZZ0214-1]